MYFSEDLFKMQLNNASVGDAKQRLRPVCMVGNGFPTVYDLCRVHGTYTSCRQVSGHWLIWQRNII